MIHNHKKAHVPAIFVSFRVANTASGMTALTYVILVSLFLAGLDAAFYKPIAIWQIDITMDANEWSQLMQDSYETYNMTVRVWGPINQNASVKELNGTKFNETCNGTIEVHGASSRYC